LRTFVKFNLKNLGKNKNPSFFSASISLVDALLLIFSMSFSQLQSIIFYNGASFWNNLFVFWSDERRVSGTQGFLWRIFSPYITLFITIILSMMRAMIQIRNKVQPRIGSLLRLITFCQKRCITWNRREHDLNMEFSSNVCYDVGKQRDFGGMVRGLHLTRYWVFNFIFYLFFDSPSEKSEPYLVCTGR
jgi:hypothetical protein